MPAILDVNTVFFTLLGYPMSYIEFFGTLLNLGSVYLVTRNSIWTWPVGNLAVILFGILFYQIQLYSDAIEQVYFLIAGLYGWWAWAVLRNRDDAGHVGPLRITSSPFSLRAATGAAVVAGTAALGFLMSRIHLLLPALFAQPADFAYLDAFTTVMSMAATLLMAHKKIECWLLWIAVDVIGIGLYIAKDVFLVAMLYAIFLCLATKGWINWSRIRAAEAAPS